jgi:hypothetical protein
VHNLQAHRFNLPAAMSRPSPILVAQNRSSNGPLPDPSHFRCLKIAGQLQGCCRWQRFQFLQFSFWAPPALRAGPRLRRAPLCNVYASKPLAVISIAIRSAQPSAGLFFRFCRIDPLQKLLTPSFVVHQGLAISIPCRGKPSLCRLAFRIQPRSFLAPLVSFFKKTQYFVLFLLTHTTYCRII